MENWGCNLFCHTFVLVRNLWERVVLERLKGLGTGWVWKVRLEWQLCGRTGENDGEGDVLPESLECMVCVGQFGVLGDVKCVLLGVD